MHATEGTVLIKMFAQKIISRVALLIMTNACKGSARKRHTLALCVGVFTMETRTDVSPPLKRKRAALFILLFLVEAVCWFVWPPGDVTLLLIGSLLLLRRSDSTTLM